MADKKKDAYDREPGTPIISQVYRMPAKATPEPAKVEPPPQHRKSDPIPPSDSVGSIQSTNEEGQEVQEGQEAPEETTELETTPTSEAEIPAQTKPKNCCRKFWDCIFCFFANDRIYGSLIGPHPTSFFICCKCCLNKCNPCCVRPFTFASLSTKLMYFIMMLSIVVLSCFFIIPTPTERVLVTKITDFKPCVNNVFVDSLWGDCKGHGGYFMVYRNFFALNFYFLCMSLLMIGVTSTTKSSQRKKMHHGFWLYKYLILAGLLVICYVAIPIAIGGVFEYSMMWIGLISTLLFSMVQLVFILDLIELWGAKCTIKSLRNLLNPDEQPKKSYAYIVAIVMVVLINGVILGTLCTFYILPTNDVFRQMKEFYMNPDDTRGHTNEAIKIPTSTKLQGCWLNAALLAYVVVSSVILLAVNVIPATRRSLPNAAALQSAIVVLYNMILIWSAMGSQTAVECRPMWRRFFHKDLLPGNKETYFTLEGFIHGLGALLTLYYYIFWHGPRSTSAPLSRAFDIIMYRCAKKPQVPVMNVDNPTSEQEEALTRFKVWDNEQKGVAYSWSLFYVFLMIGSMTLCAAMTNFSNPWAEIPMAASLPALIVKIIISVLTFTTFLWGILLKKCTSRVEPALQHI